MMMMVMVMVMWIDCECRWSDKLGKICSDNVVRQLFWRQELVSYCCSVTACRHLAVVPRNPTVHSTESFPSRTRVSSMADSAMQIFIAVLCLQSAAVCAVGFVLYCSAYWSKQNWNGGRTPHCFPAILSSSPIPPQSFLHLLPFPYKASCPLQRPSH